MNFIIYLFLLLSLFFILICDSSLTFEKLGDFDYLLNSSPEYSNGNTCNFKGYIKCTSDETINSINVDNVNVTANANSIINSGKSMIMEIGMQNMPVSNIPYSNIIFIESLDGRIYNFSFQFSCKDLNSGGLNFVANLYYISQGLLYVIIEAPNLPDRDIKFIGSPSIISSTFIGNKKHILTYSYPSTFPNSGLHIEFPTSSKNLLLDPFKTDTTSDSIVYNFYPNTSTLINGNGVGIIIINSNSSNIFFSVGGLNKYSIKIGESNGQSFYLANFYTPSLSGLINYTIDIQNGSDIIKKDVTFTHSVISHDPIIVHGTYNFSQNYTSTNNDFYIESIKFRQIIKIQSKNNKLGQLFYGFFGFCGGNSTSTQFSVSAYDINAIVYGSYSISVDDPSTPVLTDTVPPLLKSYSLQQTSNFRFILKLEAYDKSGVKSIKLSDNSYYTYGSSLVSHNTSTNITSFEINSPIEKFEYIYMCDIFQNCITHPMDTYIYPYLNIGNDSIAIEQPKSIISSTSFNYDTFKYNITFMYDHISVEGQSVANVMYIYTTYVDSVIVKVQFYPSSNPDYQAPVYFAEYNINSQRYEIKFIIPANINPGPLSYIITLDEINNIRYYSENFNDQSQLIILNSNNSDLIGPIVTSNKLIPLVTSTESSNIGWKLTIEDNVNGFKEGYILVMSSVDMVVRNITAVIKEGDIFKGDYDFTITNNLTCVTQKFRIIYALFRDHQGWETIFDEMQPTLMNPFYPILNYDLPSYTLICDSNRLTKDGTSVLPQLISFNPNTTVINVGRMQEIFIQFATKHPDGILLDSVPIIYLSTMESEFIESSPKDTTYTIYPDGTIVYTSYIKIPIGFGSISGILLNIFGIVSNAGTHNGYDTKKLQDNGFISRIATAISTDSMILTGSSRFFSNGGQLFIYGRFLSQAGQVYIYINNTSNAPTSYTPDVFTDTLILINNVLPSKFKMIVQVHVQFSSEYIGSSNYLEIYPSVFENVQYEQNPTMSTPTPSVSPTPTSTPTNKPCKTTCGQSNNQGYCSNQGYCVCYSPYTGSSCESKILIVPPPLVNETNPSTEIIIPPIESTEITYSSIVSIVSIREIDFNQQVFNNYEFEKWVYKPILNTTEKKIYSYFSNISIANTVVSNITALLEWNSKSSVVNFAGDLIELNPSSIKYTITISSYPFKNQLSSLQLIMSTVIQRENSNGEDDEVCSNKQFGDSSSSIDNKENSDSNYIQLQVDNTFFYGRFIKRCLLDSEITSVTNTFLDKDDIGTNSSIISNKINSFIGINIKNYKNQVIIDPDFSVLLGQSDNSCLKNDKGLTKSQLIGIIIGSVCFFIVIVAIVIFLSLKSSRCLPFKIFVYKTFRKNKY